MSDWSHEALREDLARTRLECGEVVAEELTLGPGYGRAAIADVLAVRPSWTRWSPTVWECKVSRADFLADVRSEKYRKYLPFCERFYYAVPRGLVDRREVPAGCGLSQRGARGWYTLVPPQVRRFTLEETLASVLLMALVMRQHPAGWRNGGWQVRMRSRRWILQQAQRKLERHREGYEFSLEVASFLRELREVVK